jgi:hypothetical protein
MSATPTTDTNLILDREKLETMGLHGEALFVIEYDLNSPILIGEHATEDEKKELEKRNKEAVKIRNKMAFALKFQIKATKHLESSWLIDRERLESAKIALEALKEEMRSKGFDNVDKRVRIIPIYVTEVGFENYEDMKVQFLLQFAAEHIGYCDKGLEEQRMPRSTLWRCKKAVEIITELKEELKQESDKNEVTDTVSILDDKVCKAEAMVMKLEEEAKENKNVK